ncbi:hypothetical protein V2I01_32240 [Micromonospora sp. BRA006-A]|nr:hypothetical protein [Micromonospora sp. BRA006-A]
MTEAVRSISRRDAADGLRRPQHPVAQDLRRVEVGYADRISATCPPRTRRRGACRCRSPAGCR